VTLIRPAGTFPWGKVKSPSSALLAPSPGGRSQTMLRPYDCGDLRSCTVKEASPGTACVPKAKLASAARLMRVLRDPHPPCGHLPPGEGKKPLIRPAGTFPQGKVKSPSSALRAPSPGGRSQTMLRPCVCGDLRSGTSLGLPTCTGGAGVLRKTGESIGGLIPPACLSTEYSSPIR